MKKFAIVILSFAFTAPALAQQPTEATVKLTLTLEKLSVLAQALEAMPYKVAAPMINDINQQIKAQQHQPQQTQQQPKAPSPE